MCMVFCVLRYCTVYLVLRLHTTLNWSLYRDIVSLVICEQVYSQLKHLLKIKKLTIFGQTTMVNVFVQTIFESESSLGMLQIYVVIY